MYINRLLRLLQRQYQANLLRQPRYTLPLALEAISGKPSCTDQNSPPPDLYCQRAFGTTLPRTQQLHSDLEGFEASILRSTMAVYLAVDRPNQ